MMVDSSHPWAAGRQMLENAGYVKAELPKVFLTDDLRAKVTGLCDGWIETYFDLIDCSRDLADRWVRQSIEEADAVVRLLDAASEADSRLQSAYLLISESATDVLLAYAGQVT